MIVTKSKDKKGNLWYNLIFKKADLKTCKNQDYVKLGFKSDYLVGLKDKKTIEISKLDFNKIEAE